MIHYTKDMMNIDADRVAHFLSHVYGIPQVSSALIAGIPRGGEALAKKLGEITGQNVTMIGSLPNAHDHDWKDTILIVVDDVVDSGTTMSFWKKELRNIPFLKTVFVALHKKPKSSFAPDFVCHETSEWIHYWWEGDFVEDSIKDSVIRQLQYVGEDVKREGLIDTPSRVVKSWGKLYGGYKEDPTKILATTFAEGSCDEMVILKSIEIYSTCEHHMLPFFGKCHIGYLPDKKVVGVSKLARLMECFSRRLQIQERLCQQITKAMDDCLRPRGSACVIEAQHFCMTSRGVEKQNSIMVTSSLTGVFRESKETRQEFLSIIKQ